MKVECRLLDGAAVLDLEGKLDCGNGDRDLRRVFDSLVKQGRSRVVVNLARVCHMDTTCLGQLIEAHVRLTQRGGGLHLCAVPDRIRHVLKIAKLDTVLLAFDGETQAVAGFTRASSRCSSLAGATVQEHAC